MRTVPAADVGVLRRYRRNSRQPGRQAHRLQALHALPASVLIQARGVNLRKIAVAVALTLVAASALARQADIIITGGTVLTMAGPNIENGAVAIEGHTIAAVGKALDIA